MKTKRVEEVVGKCIDFDKEFECPNCNTLLVPVCINLGTIGGRKDDKLYCSRNFPVDCSPKYTYVGWLDENPSSGERHKGKRRRGSQSPVLPTSSPCARRRVDGNLDEDSSPVPRA
ncbi:MAG: hypothetical protein QW356_04175 [Candidatus Hadarchaeales archaeon]